MHSYPPNKSHTAADRAGQMRQFAVRPKTLAQGEGRRADLAIRRMPLRGRAVHANRAKLIFHLGEHLPLQPPHLAKEQVRQVAKEEGLPSAS